MSEFWTTRTPNYEDLELLQSLSTKNAYFAISSPFSSQARKFPDGYISLDRGVLVPTEGMNECGHGYASCTELFQRLEESKFFGYVVC